MKAKTVKKTDSTDALYNEALDSLKKLNEEILLNKMNDDFKALIRSLQDEMENFNESLQGDFAILNGSIQRTTSLNENNTKDVIQKLEENSDFFMEKLQAFSQYFKSGVQSIINSTNQANSQFLEQIQGNIHTYEENFQQINDQHVALTKVNEQQNKELEQLIQSFLHSMKKNEATLKQINENWLASMDSLNVAFKSEVDTLKEQVKDSEMFYERVKSDLFNEINQLVTLNTEFKQTFETAMNSNEQLKIQAEQNQEIVEQALAEIKTEVNELKQQNELLKQELQVYELANKKGQKISLAMQIITIVGVIVTVVLSI